MSLSQHDAPEFFLGTIGATYEDSIPWRPPVETPDRRTSPNVVFIVLDDVGFADLGCYGSEVATPNINSLANNGLQFTNFHATSLCSPSRACLMTGRNAHSVGVGTAIEVAEGSNGYPGYRGRIRPQASTVAETLQSSGYATLAAGKWHLMPMEEATAAGPFGDWPLQRGFDRWIGFHGAQSDQWRPELFIDNHTVDTTEPPGEEEHLSEVLVNGMIKMIKDVRNVHPDRPFFAYLAFGAAHFPLQVPSDYVDRYAGRYDLGWDAIRRERYERQLSLGVIPQGTVLPPRNEGVAAWSDLGPNERQLFARMQEVYAGFLEHTDAQIGRLLDLISNLGEIDDTVVVLLADNGASSEGKEFGAVNARKNLDFERETVAENMKYLGVLGSSATYPHYPTGWAQASNTPLRWYKRQVHGGGVRCPLLIQWPRRVQSNSSRHQFVHVIDIVPTLLELLGLDAPAVFRGVPQMAMEGRSFAHLMDRGDHPAQRSAVQYFECLGSRGIWMDGWKALTRHVEGADYQEDTWELYDTHTDFSESQNLSEQHPDLVEELIELWWREARKYCVLPLDDRVYARKAAAIANRARRHTLLRPGTSRLDRFHVPDIGGSSAAIRSVVTLTSPTAQGVLLSIGARFGGLTMYIQGQRVIVEYAYDQASRQTIRSKSDLPVGRDSQIELRLERDENAGATAGLLIDNTLCDSIRLPKTWPVAGLTGGLHCGRDGCSPVSESYLYPAAFTGGVLHYVEFELFDVDAPVSEHIGVTA